MSNAWLSEWNDELIEEEFRVASLPPRVREAFSMGPLSWPLAVRRALDAGITKLEDLSDMVFFMHHPERLQAGAGQRLRAGDRDYDRLSREWKAWRTLIAPQLSAHLKSRVPATPVTPSASGLRYGVPGGTIGSPFDHWRSSPAYVGYHLGIDVSTSRKAGGGAEDPRRGLPVYLTIKPRIAKSALDSARIARTREKIESAGLGLVSRGDALLQEVRVLAPWSFTKPDHAYGGAANLACVYAFVRSDSSPGRFSLYTQYLHLITAATLPFPGGTDPKITLEQWRAAGKADRIGFGPRIREGTKISVQDVTARPPILIGYMGATRWPHVHIQVSFALGDPKSIVPMRPRIDPVLVVE